MAAETRLHRLNSYRRSSSVASQVHSVNRTPAAAAHRCVCRMHIGSHGFVVQYLTLLIAYPPSFTNAIDTMIFLQKGLTSPTSSFRRLRSQASSHEEQLPVDTETGDLLSIVHPIWQGVVDEHAACAQSLTLQHALTRSSSSSCWSFDLVDDDEPDTPRADEWLHAGPSINCSSASRSVSGAKREAPASGAVQNAKVRLLAHVYIILLQACVEREPDFMFTFAL
jgi:hypothetical protein